MPPEPRKLNVFLSYASQDEARVRELFARLCVEPWISPWFDKEKLLPGMDWDLEIYKGLRAADAIIICLSAKSVSKEGYVQKEIKRALDISDEKPEGTIYVIPVRLDDCEVPLRIKRWQWVDYYVTNAHEKLLKSLRIRANGLNIFIANSHPRSVSAVSRLDIPVLPFAVRDLHTFLRISSPVLNEIFWIGKYPVTNAQYARFLQADDFANPNYWIDFPKYDENRKLIGTWGM